MTFSSIGQVAYLSLLQECNLIVGNSSSGIIEAPLLGTPTVNVGSRQDGRPRAGSVIDIAPDRQRIRAACLRAIELGSSNDPIARSPYRLGASMAEHVIRVLTALDPVALKVKPFTAI